MLHSDNVLLAEYIRRAHDPDPRRAAWFRPFASSVAPVRFEGLPVLVPPPRRTGALSLLAGWLGSVRHQRLPMFRLRSASCCPPGCCAVACC